MPEVTLDAGKTACGDLIFLIFCEMKKLKSGQVLRVLAYDDAADMDIPAWCRSTGNHLIKSDTQSSPKQFEIRKV